MKTAKNLIKRVFSMYLVLIIVLSVIINIVIGYNEVQAVTYTQYKKTGIDEFPESYQTHLRELAELHPNWNFTAFYTGISWNDFMNNESSLGGSKYSHGKNTIINSADSLWKDSCGVVRSGYACASPDIIAYFADPRNFLTETGAFQFLEMSYNSDVHVKSGVESIIKNTFMDASVNISGEKKEINVKAKIKDKYILVTPGTTYKEIASTLGIDNYKIASGTHVWNAVKLDGQWYHLDLTWDDPVSNTGEDILDYKFFLVKNKDLEDLDKNSNDHKFDKSIYLEFKNN